MGSRIEGGEHPCAAIESASSLKKLTILVENISKSCIDALPFSMSAKDYKTLPFLVANKQFGKIKESLKDSFWKELSKSAFRSMVKVSEGKICGEIDLKTFHLLPVAALEGVGPKCAVLLPFLKDLLPEEIQGFADDAFSLFTVETIKPLSSLTHLRPAQLALLSDQVTEPSKHAIRSVDATTLSKLSFAHVSRSAWASLDPALFKVISTPVILASIPPENMVDWKLNQVKEIPVKVLETMSAEQAEKIGLKDEKVAEYLDGLGLDEKARIVMSKRHSGASKLSSSALSASIILTAIVALLVA
jgi:hypothetical protein